MSTVLTLKVETRLEELDRIFASVEGLAEREDWSPALTFKVHLIIEEMGLNVINYGYDPEQGLQEFDITLTSEPETLTIEITDSGRPFNPLQDASQAVTDAALEDRPIGGLGLHLVKEMTENIQYRREHSKNHSKMVIRKSE